MTNLQITKQGVQLANGNTVVEFYLINGWHKDFFSCEVKFGTVIDATIKCNERPATLTAKQKQNLLAQLKGVSEMTEQVIVIKGENTIQTAEGTEVTIYKKGRYNWTVIFNTDEMGGTIHEGLTTFRQCLKLISDLSAEYAERIQNNPPVEVLQTTYRNIKINKVRETYWTVTATSERFGYNETMYEGCSLEQCRSYIFNLQVSVMEALENKCEEEIVIEEGCPSYEQHQKCVAMASTAFTSSHMSELKNDGTAWLTVFNNIKNLPHSFKEAVNHQLRLRGMSMYDVISMSFVALSNQQGFHTSIRVATVEETYFTFNRLTPINSVLTMDIVRGVHFSPTHVGLTVNQG